MSKGYFITFEGPDGSGKTTQIVHTAEYLRSKGFEVICTREPGGTESAEKIRNFLLDVNTEICSRTEALLYCAARAEHVEKVIKPALKAGKIVICDRFTDSTMVYQGFVRGLAVSDLTAMGSFATGGMMPKLTFLLDGDPELLLKRRQKRAADDRFEREGIIFQKKVRRGFRLLANVNPKRIKTVDAVQDEVDVQKDIRKILEEAGLV